MAMLLTACGTNDEGTGGTDASDAGSTEAASGDVSCDPFGPSERVESAHEEDVAFPWDRPDPVVAEDFDLDELISGGPPPDGIPSIDEPCFGPHVAGEPLVVTYCPLCNSGLAFERTVDGEVLEFGTSGRLFQANLVMYDRQHKSLWIQFTGEAVVGQPWVGTELERISTALVAWETFEQNHPDGLVLGRDTGHDRTYGRNPYPGYEDSGAGFLFEGPTDHRLPPNTRVVGLGAEGDGDPLAVVLQHLRDERVVRIEVGGGPITLWWAPGKASALGTSEIDEGRDVGQTTSYRPLGPDGQPLHFSASEEDPTRFVDEETGSTWNLDGRAVAGDLEGTQLEAVPRDHTFWFVWFSFQPETTVLGADALGGQDE